MTTQSPRRPGPFAGIDSVDPLVFVQADDAAETRPAVEEIRRLAAARRAAAETPAPAWTPDVGGDFGGPRLAEGDVFIPGADDDFTLVDRTELEILREEAAHPQRRRTARRGGITIGFLIPTLLLLVGGYALAWILFAWDFADKDVVFVNRTGNPTFDYVEGLRNVFPDPIAKNTGFGVKESDGQPEKAKPITKPLGEQGDTKRSGPNERGTR